MEQHYRTLLPKRRHCRRMSRPLKKDTVLVIAKKAEKNSLEKPKRNKAVDLVKLVVWKVITFPSGMALISRKKMEAFKVLVQQSGTIAIKERCVQPVKNCIPRVPPDHTIKEIASVVTVCYQMRPERVVVVPYRDPKKKGTAMAYLPSAFCSIKRPARPKDHPS